MDVYVYFILIVAFIFGCVCGDPLKKEANGQQCHETNEESDQYLVTQVSYNLERLRDKNTLNLVITWEAPTNPTTSDFIRYNTKYSIREYCGFTNVISNGETNLKRQNAIKIKDLPSGVMFNLTVEIQVIILKQDSPEKWRKCFFPNINTFEASEDPPKSPSGLQPVSSSTFSLVYSWDEITCNTYIYDVTYMGNPVPFTPKAMIIDSRPGVDICGLVCGKKYQFRVAVNTTTGTGPYSKFTAFSEDETLPCNESEALQNLESVSLDSNIIELSWDEPAAAGSQYPLLYEVEKQLVILGQCGISFDERQKVAEGLSNTSFIMKPIENKLQPFSTYTFYVVAIVNEIHTTESSINVTTSETEPSSFPSDLAVQNRTESSIHYSWGEIDCNATNGNITHYVYEVIDDPNGLLPVKDVGIITENHYVTIGGLRCGKTYQFKVAGLNKVGQGPYTNISARTLIPPPAPVRNITVSSVSPSSLNVAWKEPLAFPGCPQHTQINYDIVYEVVQDQKPECSSAENEAVATNGTDQDISSTNVTITGLYSNSMYRVQVRVANTSEESDSGPYETGEGATSATGPGPVNNIKNVSSSASIALTWDQPSYRGCPPLTLFYQVEYKLLNRSGCGIEGEDTSRNTSDWIQEMNYNIDNLISDSTYSVTVKSRNNNSMDGTVNLNILTAESAPTGPPTNVTVQTSTNTSLKFQWKRPLCKEQNGNIIGYAYSLNNNNGLIDNGNTDQSFLMFTELTPYVKYKLTVAARTSVGVGPYHPIVQRTKQGIPPAPSGLYVTEKSSTTVNLTWMAPDPPHGIITEYVIRYRKESGTPNAKIVTSINNQITLDVLQPASNYLVKVSACTDIGTGRFTALFPFQTNEERPFAPSNLTMVNNTNSSITMMWAEPDPFRGTITQYQANYRITDTKPIDRTLNITGNLEKAVFVGLRVYCNYSIKVRGYTKIGAGNWSEEVVVSTTEGAPEGPPINLNVTKKRKLRLTIKWDPPIQEERNGIIIGYRCKISDTKGWIKMLTVNSTKKTFDELVPYTNYVVEIAAMTLAGDGPYSTPLIARTIQAKPPAPSGLKIPSQNDTSITFTWSVPEPPHGIIVKYHIMFWKTADNKNRITNNTLEVTGSSTQCIVMGLDSYSNYSIRVSAETVAGIGSWSDVTTAVTQEGIPSEPLIVSWTSYHTSIHLKWRPPGTRNGEIKLYEVRYRPIDKPYDQSFDPKSKNNEVFSQHVGGYIREIHLTDSVHPSTKYEILLSANTSVGRGDTSAIEIFTLPANDIGRPLQAKMIDYTSTSLKINIPTVESAYVVSYQIGVRHQESRVKRYSETPLSYEINPSDYIAAEIPKSTAKEPFEVGDNKTYGIYYNAPLKEGVTYDIKVRALSRANESSYTEWGEPLTFTSTGIRKSHQASGAAAGISVVIVLLFLVCAFLAVVVVYKRRHAKLKTGDGHNGIESMELDQKKHVNKGDSKNAEGSSTRVKVLPSVSELKANKKPATVQRKDTVKVATIKPRPHVQDDYKPVPLDKLSKYIQTHRAGYRHVDDENDEEEEGTSGFTKEFKSIPFSQTHPCNISRHPDNVKKNRYLDIAAYDHSRVKLQLLDGIPHSDYINASFVKGYKEKVYIACQGPNSMTVHDMWRMIREQKSAKVVMLTNLIEKGKIKCERYWPAELNEYQQYGLLLVQMTTEECFANYTIRTFQVKTVDGDLPAREFKQFHYTTWPDMGVPQSATPLLNFMEVAGSYTFEGAGPDIVHCSAGVGRTGTYIVIEAMLSMASEEGQIDVHGMVRQLRKGRVKMVQTEAQYEFIFDAVLESIFCGDTSIMVTDLRAKYASLLAKDKTSGKTQLEEQFETLESLTEFPPPNAYKGGKLEENADKNRFPDKIPPDRVRPYLMTPGTEGSTNYINAAYLDGYRGKAMYLATQMPLPNTVNDIWRMVYDYKSSTIVMLNDMDKDNPTIGQYWPDSGSQDYGQIEVTLESMNKYDEIIARTFAVKFGDTSDSVTVQQLQFTGWPAGTDVPNNVTSLLTLVNLLMQHHKGGPITVHCMDSVGRSGTFCALLSVLERMQEEKVVDVFQAVRRLRRGRPGVVKTLGQYKLLYEAAQANLEEYSIYENFNA